MNRRTLILGTAGHVDHGKTTLVRALTGTDTDRLEEEHRRGISIELGFAHLKLADDVRVGVVDVPGHERFVRQMVAGAGGMDLVMLLIAADEGVMPQTREHFDVLRLLNVSSGLIVLTKTDLADPELREVVREEVIDLVAGSFLEDAPIVEVSAQTGEGLDELRAQVLELARTAPEKGRSGDFRVPVDRVFAMPGAGVVITGTAWAGSVKVGDSLRLLPTDRAVRVREVQSHGDNVPEAFAGARVALALNGAKKDEVSRGDALVSGDAWVASTVVGVHVTAVVKPAARAPMMKQRVRLHVNHAAREVLARLDIVERDELPFGESAYARLLLEEPLVARPGDSLVLRSYSPTVTVAGGIVLDPSMPERQRRAQAADWLRRCHERGSDEWPWLRVERNGLRGRLKAEVRADFSMLGYSRKQVDSAIQSAQNDGTVITLGDSLVAAPVVAAAAEEILTRVRAHQAKEPMTPGLSKEELRSALGFTGAGQVFSQFLQRLASHHPLFVLDDRVRADTAAPELNVSQEEKLAAFEERVSQAQPAYQATEEEMRSPELRLLVGAGRVEKLGGRLLTTRSRMDGLIARTGEHFAKNDALEVSDVKEWTGGSRKFVVPMLEWLDHQEVTRFDGGKRRRGPRCP